MEEAEKFFSMRGSWPMSASPETACPPRLLLAGLLTATFGATPSGAEPLPSAEQLLQDMIRVGREYSYEGTLIYRRGPFMSTLHVTHYGLEDGDYERLISLDGKPRKVIRGEDGVTSLVTRSGSRTMRNHPSLRADDLRLLLLRRPLAQLRDCYDMQVVGEGRVAGRLSWIVNLRPFDALRYGYRFWIDRDSRLFLRSELKNPSGGTIEQVFFTQVKILKRSSSSVSASTEPELEPTEDEGGGESLDLRVSWDSERLPRGFTLSRQGSRHLELENIPVTQFVLSDGLATVSVFVEDIEQEGPQLPPGNFKIGAMNAYTAHAGNHQITAIGVVPPHTARLIAGLVRPEGF